MESKEFRELFHFGQLETHPRVAAQGKESPLRVVWGDNSVMVVWQPGTGTRYCILFSYLPELVAKEYGCGCESLLVTMVHHRRSYPVQIHREKTLGDLFRESYIYEKFGLDCSDACQAVAAIVNCGVNCLSSDYGDSCIARVMKHV